MIIPPRGREGRSGVQAGGALIDRQSRCQPGKCCRRRGGVMPAPTGRARGRKLKFRQTGALGAHPTPSPVPLRGLVTVSAGAWGRWPPAKCFLECSFSKLKSQSAVLTTQNARPSFSTGSGSAAPASVLSCRLRRAIAATIFVDHPYEPFMSARCPLRRSQSPPQESSGGCCTKRRLRRLPAGPGLPLCLEGSGSLRQHVLTAGSRQCEMSGRGLQRTCNSSCRRRR